MSINPPLTIALIGAGNRSSTTYAPLFDFLRPWAQLVAVCDPVKEHADALSDRLDVPAFYSLPELVKARPMEAALVVAPVDIHHGISCYLMQHGIHCHVETTMSSLLVQAKEMVATAKQNNVTLRVAENFIRYPFDRIAKKIDESGFLGPVHRLLNVHDHTGYHNNSRWIHFMGAYPEAVQAIKHTMPTVPYYESSHRFHTDESFRAHFYTFPGNRLVVDLAANIKGLLGRYPRPGYTEYDGERGTIVRIASDQSNPNRGWTSDAEVRYVSDEALATKAVADQIFPIVHEAENDIWSRTYVDLPIGRIEYVNPYQMTPDTNVNHAHRNYYSVAIVDHIVDFAKAVRGLAQSEYTDQDALMAMEMEVGVRESALRNGELLTLPLDGDLASEEKMRAALREKHGVDPLDIEGMIGVKVPRP
jgi:hypothetical protein